MLTLTNIALDRKINKNTSQKVNKCTSKNSENTLT